MSVVLDRVTDEVEKTIQKLESKSFIDDPIAGAHLSKISSVMGSMQKRHGLILERAVLEALRENPNFVVWRDDHFQVPQTVDHMVNGVDSIDEAIKLIGVDYPYSADGFRELQVDAFVYNKETKILRSYEVKRGNGLHDAGKKRSMLRDTLCIQVLLKSYGKERGHDVQEAFSHIIFYYGQCSIHKPYALTGPELDDHFGFPIHGAIEEVNMYFKKRFFEIQ
jgi:hypothetical protein